MKNSQYYGQRILVVGLGASGKSAAAFLLARGAVVAGADDTIKDIEELGELRDHGLLFSSQPDARSFDLVVVSPGVPKEHALYVAARTAGIPVIGEAELALRELVSHRMLGITGTNGKTTITLLTQYLLRNGHCPTVALGNVGTPFSAAENLDANTIIVGELSSYQLETCTTRCFDRALITNITPDHLDRYSGMEEYAYVKLQIARCLKSDGILFLHESLIDEYRGVMADVRIKTYGLSSSNTVTVEDDIVVIEGRRRFPVPGMLKGLQNFEMENYLAAVALAEGYVTDDIALQEIKQFSKPAHRLQYLTTIEGVAYYDDSKATNLDATIQAVQALDSPIILIAGGMHKGMSYRQWVKPFLGKVKVIHSIGEAAQMIADDLKEAVPVVVHSNLEEGFSAAQKEAVPGDTILLAPGCSSFDQFSNYAVRGISFQEMVKKVEGRFINA